MTDEAVWSTEMAPVDYLLYRAEADPWTRSTMMSIEILDSVPGWDRLVRDLDRASRLVPRLRQRVVAPLVPIGPAQWVFDPDFDLGYHLRRIRVPAPGTRRQLLDLAQSLFAGPLDMARPLWEATLVEGLAFGGAESALLFKLSHSITDGIGGVVMDRQIRSYERDPDRGPMPPRPVPDDLEASALTRRHVRALPGAIFSGSLGRIGSLTGAAGRAIRNPGGTIDGLIQLAGSLHRIVGPPPVEPSPLLRGRGLNRRLTNASVPLDSLRRAAKGHGCSLNDAYIAALCGAMRIYHEEMGAPIAALPLAIPISLRTGDGPAGSNQWAAVRIAAPVGEVDPFRRMEMIRECVITGRSEPAITALSALSPMLARLPQNLVMMLAGAGVTSDIQASNVPGHVRDTYIGGAKVLELIPIGPLPGAAMMSVLLSHAGRCYLGVNYDTASFTEADLLDRCLADGFAEVTGLVGTLSAGSRSTR
jgi:diacylglycerol O-acyltransferase